MKTYPPMVRILPMDRNLEFDGDTIKEVQENFFLDSLPRRYDKYGKGKFRYKKSGMNAQVGAIILFQYDAQIIALAKLLKIIRFSSPSNICSKDYTGAYYFEPTSIEVFDPIGRDIIRELWGQNYIDSEGNKRPGFRNFGRAKWNLNPQVFPNFYQILSNRKKPFIKDEEILD